MFRYLVALIGALLLVNCLEKTAFSQQTYRGTTSGGFGMGGSGSGGFGSTGSGSSGFGSSGFGTSGFGSTGFGSSGFGSSGFGSSGFGSSGFGTSGFGTSGFGTGGFGTGGYGATGSFVPQQVAGQGQVGGGFNQGNFSTQYSQQRTFGQTQQRVGQQGQTSGQNTRPPVRVRLNVAFDPTPPRPASSANSSAAAMRPGISAAGVDARIAGLLERRGVADAEVELTGRTVILRGTVSDASERRMVERIVSLEPGISEVRNELDVTDEDR